MAKESSPQAIRRDALLEEMMKKVREDYPGSGEDGLLGILMIRLEVINYRLAERVVELEMEIKTLKADAATVEKGES